MDGYIYRPMRPLSRALARRLVPLPVAPDLFTACWFASYLGAAFAFAEGTLASARLGAALILLAGFFDCLDGDLARARERPSVSGAFLEQVLHWISQASLIVGIVQGYGAQVFPQVSPVLLTAIPLVADQMFHQVFFIINGAMHPERHYGMLHRLTGTLLPLMPINSNVFWISGLLGLPHYGLLAYTLLAGATFICVSSIYYLWEKGYDRHVENEHSPREE